LSGVAINTSLISDADDTDDIGSVAKEWRNIHIDGTAEIDQLNADAITMAGDITMADKDVTGIGNLVWGTSGGAVAGSPTIWVDASGDMGINVATGDSIFFTINDVVVGQTKLDSFEIRTVTQDGPDLILNNNDQSPLDNDIVGQIIWQGNDDTPSNVNYAIMTVNMDDVSAGASDADWDIRVMAGNTLAAVLDYTGSNKVLR